MKVQKISICLGLLFIFGIGNFAMAENNGIDKSTKTVKKNYRIEIKKDKKGRRKEIHLLSPDNKVIKTFSPEKVKISKKGNYLIHFSKTIENINKNMGSGYIEKERTLYDAKGVKKWVKIYKSYPSSWDPELMDPSFGEEGISDNGERTYINWRTQEDEYCVAVYDINGKELAQGCHDKYALHQIEISPDGKILGAETSILIKGKHYKHLFFIEVDTGKTKLVKAEGDGWSGTFLVKFSNPKPINQGKIYLNVTLKNEYKKINDFKVRKTFRRYVDFNKLPEDMLELIQGE